MLRRSITDKTTAPVESLSNKTVAFFSALQQDETGRKLLAEQDHRIEFDLVDGRPFHMAIQKGQIAAFDGKIMPRRFDLDDAIHFELQTATLQRLLNREIRFTDALVPADPDGKNAMILRECTLFKWSVLNWVGRMFRGAQTRQNCVSRLQA